MCCQIVSLVRGGDAARGSPGAFLSCALRSNVLLTRVRRKLYVVGTRVWRDADPAREEGSGVWPAFCRHFGGPSQEELDAELAEDAAVSGGMERDPFSAPVESGYALPEWGREAAEKFLWLGGGGGGDGYESYDSGDESYLYHR